MYATPHVQWGDQPITEEWDITDGATGYRISRTPSATVEEAILKAAAALKRYRATPESYKAAQQRALNFDAKFRPH